VAGVTGPAKSVEANQNTLYVREDKDAVMKLNALFVSIVVLGAVGCGAPEPTNSGTDQNALGFGIDNIFESTITTPIVIADANCPDFTLAAGDILSVDAQESSFSIQRADGSNAVRIQIPSQGQYVWEGTRPNRTANVVISQQLQVEASMDVATASITLENLSDQSTCLLRRCPAFGTCQ
jgi:hypothetical protein